jgi:hypothetical protein
MSAADNDSSNVQDRMLGSVPGFQALGRGPAPDGEFSRHDYHHPAAGWGRGQERRARALMRGVAKVLFERAAANPAVLDGEFLERYTHGWQDYRALCGATPWNELVHASGVPEGEIYALAGPPPNRG